MTVREMVVGGFYDYSSDKIECVADAIGAAKIFEFGSNGVVIRILAFDAEDARRILEKVERKHRW